MCEGELLKKQQQISIFLGDSAALVREANPLYASKK